PDLDTRGAIERLAPGFVVFCGMLIAAAFFHGTVAVAIWIVALVVHVAGLWMGGVRGWKVHPAHFAERHGLIVIIALGESIVSIPAGASVPGLDAEVTVGAVLSPALAAALWWSSFDIASFVAERRLRHAQGEARARMARDSYPSLPLPMVAGIVLLALG